MASDESPLSSQSTLPSRSYERTFSRPNVTSSVLSPDSQTKGVAQVVGSSRSTRQISLPVALSRATRYDWSSLSLTMYSRPSCSAGDEAVP